MGKVGGGGGWGWNRKQRLGLSGEGWKERDVKVKSGKVLKESLPSSYPAAGF